MPLFINGVRHSGAHDSETLTKALRASQYFAGPGTKPAAARGVER